MGWTGLSFWRDLQQAYGEERNNGDFLPAGDLEAPDGAGGEDENDDIGDDVEEAGEEDSDVVVEAVAVGDERVPDFLAGATCPDGGASADGIVDGRDQDDDSGADEHGGIDLLGGRKEAEVL